MRFSIKRLRWTLLGGALLLVVVLAAYIGYGRYKALKVYRNLIAHAGITVSRDSNGVTFTQSLKDKTVLTIHAARTTQISEGQYELHDVAMTVNSVKDNRTDHIYGNEFSYNEHEGVVRAIGEVHMDLQAPQSLTAAGRTNTGVSNNLAPLPAPDTESKDVIHVRTSGLVYLRRLGVATTTQPVEFRYGGITCTAVGAEFDSSQSTVRLLSSVVADGVVRDRPVHITAMHAEVDRVANIVSLEQPVATSPGSGAIPARSARADHAVLDLRKDGTIQTARASGRVQLNSPTQQINAAQLDAALSPQTLPQTAKLSGGVTLADNNPLRPVQGSAAAVDIAFDAHGMPASLTATASPQGRAQLTMLDKHNGPRGLQREMQADRIVALFAPLAQRTGARATTHLVQVQAQGNASARGESPYTPARPSPLKQAAAQFKTTAIHGDDLQLGFSSLADGQTQPKHLHATGHTLLQQDAPLAEQETSSGDVLDADFAQQPVHGKQELTLASAVQTGHVVVHHTAAENPAKPTAIQQVATATADRATYDGGTEKLTLIGGTHLTQDDTTLTATTVVLDQRTQDSDAFGDVQATLQSAASGQRPTQFTHVLSSSAHFTHESRQAEFHGTDAKPARMWQDASQVQAAVLVLDDVRRTFSARAESAGVQIHAVFTGTSTPKPGPDAKPHGNVVRVTAAKMDYSDLQREASFTGAQGVVIEGSAGTIHAERAVAYLHKAEAKTAAATGPGPFSSSLDHIVVTGNVQIDQPGRHGTGEQLVYTAATGQSVLTGTAARPPHIVDSQQGSITGVTLTVGDADSTIVVTGGPQQPGANPNETKPVRVHTETHLQPGTAERQ